MGSVVQRKDSQAALIATLTAATMMAQLVAGKALRDTVYLSTHGAEGLPAAMITAAALSLLAVLGSARLMVTYSPARVVPVAFQLGALLYVVEWLLLGVWKHAVAFLIYLHIVALGSILSSGFWSVVSERFDPHAAKAAVTRITIGGSLGGLLGGLFGWQLASMVSIPAVLVLLALFSSAAGIGVWALASQEKRAEVLESGSSRPSAPQTQSSLKTLWTVPYLRSVAVLVLLGAAIQALLDYALGVQASAILEKGPRLMTFFSAFYAAAGVLGILLQLSLSDRVLQRYGLAVTASLLPLSVMLGAGVGLVARNVIGAATARGLEAVARSSFFRASYELLYTPLAPEKKRATKTLIDVGLDRVGTAVGSGLVMLVLALGLAHTWPILMSLTMVLAVIAVVASLRLRSGYVLTLAESLRAGSVVLTVAQLSDSRTLDTLTATAKSLDRHGLLREIERLRQAGELGVPKTERSAAATQAALPLTESSPAPAVLAALLSGNANQIKEALARDWPFAPLLLGAVIDLLAEDSVAVEAGAFLRKNATQAAGQLTDALLDSRRPVAIRRRIPRILRYCPARRAVEGLMNGLSDERFETRLCCARALSELAAQKGGIQVEEAAVYRAVQIEVEAARKGEVESWYRTEEDSSSEFESGLTPEGDRRLEYVFRLLALVLEPEPVRLAGKALRTQDTLLRGTALEYLEAVLPRDVRDALFALLEVGGKEKENEKRSPREVAEDLLKSRVSIELRLEELRKAVHGEPG